MKTLITVHPRINTLPKRTKLLGYLCLFLASVLFLLLFSTWTSPLFKNWYGCDSSFFSMTGRAILSGKVIYRDIFDLKGPYFFLLQAASQLIFKGKTGTFLMQALFLWASLILIYNISKIYLNTSQSIWIIVIFLMSHIATLWGGNTLEEYCLPLSLLAVWLLLLYKKNQIFVNADDSKCLLVDLPPALSAILGFILGIIIFSKISVAAPVLGIICAVLFLQLSGKYYKNFFTTLMFVLLGISLATLPLILYFGLNGALSDMFYCVFSFAFKRSIDFAERFNIRWELKCSGIIFAFGFACMHQKRIGKEITAVLMAMSAATYILLHFGTPFYYYFTTAYPCFLLALILFLHVYDPLILFENIKQGICLIILAVFFIYWIPASLENARTTIYDREMESYQTYYNDATQLVTLIPEFEQNNVFSFLTDMTFFEINQILPCYKYPINLPFFIALDSSIQTDILNLLETDAPKWLVIGDDFDAIMPDIASVVYEKYDCIYENSAGHLYLLR